MLRSARPTDIKAARRFARGESYWEVVLTTGRTYGELDMVNDTTRGRRPLDWYLDITATGDTARIAEIWLHTPAGDVALRISEPHTAYIFNSSYMSLTEGRSPVAQIIGRVDDKVSGTGMALIWDVAHQQVYQDTEASVLDFKAWRPGIAHVGALAIKNMGVDLS